MQVPVVKTPLSIIALFVALIELFLAYPVTQLEDIERLILVVFMTVFPFFVAAAFFLLLWHKPKNLYSPGEIAEASVIERRVAAELKVEELEQEIQRLRQRAIPPQATIMTPAAAAELAKEIGQTAQSDVKAIEAQVRAQIKTSGAAMDESAVEEVKREVQRTRKETRQQKAQQARTEMSKFRHWLEGRGFADLPDIPDIVIEPPELLNAYYNPSDGTVHLGALISDDSDTLAHTYFHIVIQSFDVLTKFEGETAALAEGCCDYFACSYNGDPYLGEKFASAAGSKTGWIRNLLDVVRMDKTEPTPHAMSLVWSGACWELREVFGKEKVDAALCSALPKLAKDSTISQAAQTLQEEMAELVGGESKAKVKKVFQKRGVQVGTK